MKYVAVCVLSLVTMLSASASPSAASPSAASLVVPATAQSAQVFAPSVIEPAVRAASGARNAVEAISPGIADSVLTSLLAGALLALQLRRRQKSLRSPRFAPSAN